MSNAKAALLERMIADRTTAESNGVVMVPSKSNPFVEYRCQPSRNRCSCPSKLPCWHLVAATVSIETGRPVRDVIRQMRRSKLWGGCGKCKWCAKGDRRYPCPASPAARAYIAMVEVNRQIEAQ